MYDEMKDPINQTSSTLAEGCGMQPDLERRSIYRKLRMQRKNLGKISEYDKRVSVIIPTRNSRPYIDRCLASLANQSYPHDLMDIIIVDDESSDRITDCVSSYCGRMDTSLIENKFSGYRMSTARNQGILSSAADVLLCIDSDIICPRSFVEEHLIWFHLHASVATLGIRKFVDATGIPPSLVDADPNVVESLPEVPSISNNNEIKDRRILELQSFDSHPFPENCFHGCNIAFRRHDATSIGLFDERFDLHWGYEDIEFGHRLRKHGVSIVYEPSAVAYHQENGRISLEKRMHDGRINRNLLKKLAPDLWQWRRLEGAKVTRWDSALDAGNARKQDSEY